MIKQIYWTSIMRSCSEVSESNHFWANTCTIATAERWWFRTASVSFLLRVPIKSLAGPPTRNRIVHLMEGILGLKKRLWFSHVFSCFWWVAVRTLTQNSKFFQSPTIFYPSNPLPTMPTALAHLLPYLFGTKTTGFSDKKQLIEEGSSYYPPKHSKMP